MTMVRKFKFSQRRELPPMTPRMLEILIQLREALELDYPFVFLPHVAKRTIAALTSDPRRWIYASAGLDGTRYRITETGLKALKIYEPQLKRYDGICPECGERPKHVTENGRTEGYCIDCLRKQTKRKYHLGINAKNPAALCPRCKKRPRHVQRSGRVITFCTHCDRVRKRATKRKWRRESLKTLKAGGFVKCQKRNCSNCVHFTEQTVYETCWQHWQEYMTAYNDRRRPRSRAAQTREVT